MTSRTCAICSPAALPCLFEQVFTLRGEAQADGAPGLRGPCPG